jgi:hypothetical protein
MTVRLPVPSKRVLNTINQYLKYWKNILGLTDWEIEGEINYTLENSDEPASARVEECIPERKFAVIAFAPDVSVPQIQYFVIHELLHVLISQRRCIVKAAIEALDTPVASKAQLINILQAVEEQDVDEITKSVLKAVKHGQCKIKCSA